MGQSGSDCEHVLADTYSLGIAKGLLQPPVRSRGAGAHMTAICVNGLRAERSQRPMIVTATMRR